MPKATVPSGDLVPLSKCYLTIPTDNGGTITFEALPDLSDSKSASYASEPVPGRSFPLTAFSHSDDRLIGLQIHLYAKTKTDINFNLRVLRAIQSLTYPRTDNLQGGAPYLPPPICSIKCGQLLSKDELCVILKSYSVKFPTDVPWDEETYCPWKFDIDTNWQTAYRTSQLPGQEKIIYDI